MPAVLGAIDADEEHSIGDLVGSRGGGVAETLDAALHAAPSFSLLTM
jgi:hypothetical protein